MENTMETIMTRKREDILCDRKKLREIATNNRRLELGSAPEKTNETIDVTAIAQKLRTKGVVQGSDLCNLKNALIQSEDNISTFLNVHGALNGLIKELTGNDANKQILAAACCCNIALGPVKTCYTLVKAAGTYLITYLDSQNDQLVETCAWALGNLAGSDLKVSSLLKTQGLIPKLLPLLQMHHQTNVADAASYALAHFLLSSDSILENKELEAVAIHISECQHISNYIIWVTCMLSSKEILVDIFKSHMVFNSAIADLISIVLESNWEEQLIRVNCLIRIAANLCCHEIVNTGDDILRDEFTKTVSILLATHHNDIRKDCLWLLGNIYKTVQDSPRKAVCFSQIALNISSAM